MEDVEAESMLNENKTCENKHPNRCKQRIKRIKRKAGRKMGKSKKKVVMFC